MMDGTLRVCYLADAFSSSTKRVYSEMLKRTLGGDCRVNSDNHNENDNEGRDWYDESVQIYEAKTPPLFALARQRLPSH